MRDDLTIHPERVNPIAFSGELCFIVPAKFNFMSTIIEEKTQELCEALIAQPEMVAIRGRIDMFMANDSARSQYEALMSKGQALQEKQHHGQALEPAEISEFEKNREALLKNPVATNFLDAQEEMHAIQKSIQKRISKTLELGRLPVAADLEEGSCGSGCGCH
jgi:cell fate (sporulation/competence/biofilm development) regulator YlbF (YheA/YmcA/DUF963 family)